MAHGAGVTKLIETVSSGPDCAQAELNTPSEAIQRKNTRMKPKIDLAVTDRGTERVVEDRMADGAGLALSVVRAEREENGIQS